MKKRIIRIISLCLIAVLCLQLVPLSADALSYGGSSSYRSGKYYTALTKVKLTGNQRTDIVNVAKSQVGYQEGSSSSQLSGTSYGGRNYTEYGRWYGMQDMWCAMFVSWCANVAGISTSIVPSHAYTPSGLSWFKSRGLAYSRATVAAGKYTPQAGDIIYFKSARNSNTTNHIGIVTGYSNGTVYTVEGNTSSATISTNGGAVAAKSYSISNTYIVYICRPNYKNTSSSSSGNSGGYNVTNNWIPDRVQSIVFNPTYYANKYADLKNAFGTDANKLYQHFLDYGAKEGRQASAIFDVRTYLSKNSDLKAAFGNDYKAAIKHFASNGINEERVTAPAVNLGSSFKAKINVSTATLNLSLSDTSVIAYTPSDAAAQIWKFDRQSNGTYKITNTKTGQVLDVHGASKTAGANIHIYDSNNTSAQRWYIYESGVSGKYIFRPACAPGAIMGVKGNSTSAMANIETVNYTHSKGERFGITKISGTTQQKPAETPTVTPTETPANLGSQFYAKIATSNATNKNLSLSGSDVILFEKSKAPAQTWRFVRQSDGSYHIINQKTGEYMTVAGNSSASGANVRIEKANGSAGQKWFIYKKGSYYMLRPACSTSCVLDVYAAGTADLSELQIYTRNDTGAQLFTITKGNFFDLVGPADVGTGFIAKITNVNSGLNLSLSDTNVIIYTPSDAAAQKYKFDRQSDGSYKLTNQKNKYVLDVAGGSSANFTNVQIYASNNTAAQRWFIYLKEGSYIFRPGCAKSAVLDVYAGAKDPGTNVDIYEMNNTAAQKFTINKVDASSSSGNSTGNAYATAEQMAVLRKIIYAVETGGQVYGNARYNDFTEAYTNTSEEHAITIGAGQWFGPEAKKLLNTIRSKYPSTFASLDTAGIAKDLDSRDWSTYKLSASSSKAKCIVKIISSPEGIACQDLLIDEQMEKYLAEAKSLGVTEIKAMMMCANLRHLGGLGAVKRVLKKTATPYTLDHIYSALQTDTGNQVGAFRSRNKKVYDWLIKYIG